MAGVNHFPVVTELDVDGEDGFAVLRAMVDEAGGLGVLGPHPGQDGGRALLAARLRPTPHSWPSTFLDRWGALPAAGDRHMAEFVPWVLTEASGWGASFNVGTDRHGHPPASTRTATSPTSTRGSPAPRTLQTWPSGELPALVIDSLVTGIRRGATGQHPQRRAGARRTGGGGGRVDVRGRRGGIRGRDGPPCPPRSPSLSAGTRRSPS